MSDEGGFTLAEVLVTVLILSVAVVALVTGLMNAIAMSDIHRKAAVESTMLRSYAETIQSAVQWNPATMTGCKQKGNSTFTATYAAPTGYTVAAVDSASGLPYSLTNTPCPPSAQNITLTASSTDNRSSLTLTIAIVVP